MDLGKRGGRTSAVVMKTGGGEPPQKFNLNEVNDKDLQITNVERTEWKGPSDHKGRHNLQDSEADLIKEARDQVAVYIIREARDQVGVYLTPS